MATPAAPTPSGHNEMIMPASPERAAREVDDAGPEGRPSIPKAGPGLMIPGLVLFAVVIVGAAVLIGMRFNWYAGLGALGLGLFALLVNPVVGAALERRRDRQKAVDHIERSGGATPSNVQR
jgi:hypothetical protein